MFSNHCFTFGEKKFPEKEDRVFTKRHLACRVIFCLSGAPCQPPSLQAEEGQGASDPELPSSGDAPINDPKAGRTCLKFLLSHHPGDIEENLPV